MFLSLVTTHLDVTVDRTAEHTWLSEPDNPVVTRIPPSEVDSSTLDDFAAPSFGRWTNPATPDTTPGRLPAPPEGGTQG